jgi:hypothetical protein
MLCHITRLRKEGVDLPRHLIREQHRQLGHLEVLDVRDDGVGRTIKVARQASVHSDFTLTLYDPQLLWLNEARFTLTGFERVKYNDGRTVNYAQSWLVALVAADVKEPAGR